MPLKPSTTSKAVLKGHHIYLVEDNDSFRVSLNNAFTTLGYTVHGFESASSFLACKEFFWPALLICDVRLPQISGVELQKKLLDEGLGMPIIFVSGESTLQEGITGMKQGAIDFLIKPFKMPDLLRLVVQTFEKQLQELTEQYKLISKEEKLQRLAPREREVCELMSKGYANPEMAQELQISVETIKQYKKNIYSKLEVESLATLVALIQRSSN